MYSYDVSASHRRSTTASRAIPGMRPSYDAEHPHSATPIYDELYSEYRRLFRALPGDRSGEEDLKFTGFAVRDGSYPVLTDPRPYPPQHQAFQTYGGQGLGIPQFMPSQQAGQGHAGHSTHQPHNGHSTHHHSHAPHAPHGGHSGHSGHTPHGGGVPQAAADRTGPANATSDGTGHAVPADRHGGHDRHSGHGHPTGPAGAPVQDAQPAQPAAQFTNGQGWVAAGYLGPVPHPMPAAPTPAPVMTSGPATGGRHRNLLSLPPGRGADQH
ncbi:hypothetical protein OH807_30015 [Kitasatospora sp. NBC_01560]|uniref:hypothetical protein n=1 Tax=Kitasatospora sp. NBC_01560 TaxID=2975965 RepID=UPI003867B95A